MKYIYHEKNCGRFIYYLKVNNSLQEKLIMRTINIELLNLRDIILKAANEIFGETKKKRKYKSRT
jgi:hypothetical protein